MTTLTEATVSHPIRDLDDAGPLADFREGRRLVGTACESCGTLMLGRRVVCSSCVSEEVALVALPATGVLYSFTRLHVGSEGVRPLGYVDLGDVRTLTDLRESIPLVPGQRVELVVDGDDWCFAPITEEVSDVR